MEKLDVMSIQIDSVSGWIKEARRLESPNFDERGGTQISLIVLHGISLPPGEYGGPWVDALFTNRLDTGAHPFFEEIEGLKVSSHLLIRRDGELVQYVSLNDRAWHAGVSCYEGREQCNDFSIGIELEGCDDEPYEEAQYQRLFDLIPTLITNYPDLSEERIVGHCDIAPGRKTDPGPCFDWSRLHQELRRKLLT